MTKQDIIIGSIIGILCNVVFLIICFTFFSTDHAKIEDLVIWYSSIYFCITLIALFIKRSFALGLLVAYFIPVLVFIILQLLVLLSYRGLIP